MDDRAKLQALLTALDASPFQIATNQRRSEQIRDPRTPANLTVNPHY